MQHAVPKCVEYSSGLPVDRSECDGAKVKRIPGIIVQLYSIAWVFLADCQHLSCGIRHLHLKETSVMHEK